MKAAASLVGITVAAVLTFNLNAQPVTTHVISQVSEPPNLGLLKTKLKSYHDCTCTCGCYTRSLDLQERRAMTFLERTQAKKRAGEKSLLRNSGL